MHITEKAKSEETDIEDTERDRWRKEMRFIHDVLRETETDRLVELYKDEQIDRIILNGEIEMDSGLYIMETETNRVRERERHIHEEIIF